MPDLLSAVADRKAAEAAGLIAELAAKAGGTAYLVGGCVRDYLSGIAPHDLDIEVHGLAADTLTKLLAAHFKLNLVGSSFGVIKLSGVEVDVSLPRRENKTGQGHRGFMVDFDPTLTVAEAAARRDFTVNAIMFNLAENRLVDPHGGMSDLEKKVIRPVSGHFSEDPLRVLRGMQFIARFGYAPAPELIGACREMTPEGLAVERLGEEWKKLLLKGVKPSAGLEFLRETGWLKYYPELDAMVGCPQYHLWHPEGDVWTHTLLCLDAAAGMRSGNDADDLVFMLAVLCHDFGKPEVTEHEPDGRITSRNHEVTGGPPTRAFIARLWRDTALTPAVLPLVENHLRPYTFFYEHASDRAMRRLAVKVKRLDLLAKVAYADSAGRAPTPPDKPPIDWFLERANALEVAAAAPKPLILGRHVLAMGVKPGPEVGKITSRCFEAQLDGEFDDLPSGLEYLEKLLG
ncbi:MAG: CCA tRNA nucleotidyltransferase [Victivallaceae bacterium]|nr:hypothetical protein [Victivallaceae bacterium]